MKRLVLTEFLHGEAFCLMQYRCKSCGQVEHIYNSRDGVSPFGVDSLCCEGAGAGHFDWKQDIPLAPEEALKLEHAPSRVFIDFRFASALDVVKAQIENGWDDSEHPISAMYDTRAEAIVGFLESWTKDIGMGPETVSWEDYLALPPRLTVYERKEAQASAEQPDSGKTDGGG